MNVQQTLENAFMDTKITIQFWLNELSIASIKTL